MITEKTISQLQKILDTHKLGGKTLRETEEDVLDALKIPYPSVVLKLNPEITPEQIEGFKKEWIKGMSGIGVQILSGD